MNQYDLGPKNPFDLGPKQQGTYSELLPQQAISEEQFQVPGSENAAKTMEVLGSPNEPSFDPSGLEGWEYKGGLVAGTKRAPGFMKTLEQWGTGAALGGLKWGGALLLSNLEKIIPKSKTLGTDADSGTAKTYKALEQHAADLQDEYKGSGLLVGEIIGGMAGAAIPGSLYTKGIQAGKAGASLLGSKLGLDRVAESSPQILKKAAGFTGKTAENAGMLGAISGAEYDPENPGYSAGKAIEAATDPVNLAIGAGGALASKYMQNVRDYAKVRKDLPSAFYMDTKEPGPWHSLTSMFLDAPYALVPKLTARGAQESAIKGDVSKWISGISGISGTTHFKDYAKFVSNKIQGTVKRLKKGEQQIWESGGFKSLPINKEGVEQGSQIASQAMSLLEQNKVPLSGELKKVFSKLIKTESDDSSLAAIGIQKAKNITVNDIRNLQVELGGLASSYGKATSSAAEKQIAAQLQKIRSDLFQPIKGSIPADKQTAISEAIEYSRLNHEFFNSVPGVERAAKNDFAAKKIALQFLKESETFDKASLMNQLSTKGQSAAKAGWIANAFEKSTSPTTGKLNLMKFTEHLKESSPTPEFLGTDLYKSVEGVSKVLQNIYESQKINWAKQLTMTGMAVGTAGALGVGGATIGGPDGVAAAMSYPALMIIAHNPVLKKTLGHFTKKLSDSTYKALVDVAQKQAQRAGIIFNAETGEITHKDE